MGGAMQKKLGADASPDGPRCKLSQQSIILINFGSVKMICDKKILKSQSEYFEELLPEGKSLKRQDGIDQISIARNGEIFKYLYEFMTYQHCEVPKKDINKFAVDADFYRVKHLQNGNFNNLKGFQAPLENLNVSHILEYPYLVFVNGFALDTIFAPAVQNSKQSDPSIHFLRSGSGYKYQQWAQTLWFRDLKIDNAVKMARSICLYEPRYEIQRQTKDGKKLWIELRAKNGNHSSSNCYVISVSNDNDCGSEDAGKETSSRSGSSRERW